MRDNISYMSGAAVPNVKEMIEAARFYMSTWQQGDLAFQAQLQEVLARHNQLLDKAQQVTGKDARNVVALISGSVLEPLLEELANDADEEVLQLGAELRDDVSQSLSVFTDHLRGSRAALSSLPLLEGKKDESRLAAQKQSLLAAQDLLAIEVEVEQEKLRSIVAVINALEAKELKLDLGNLVPTSEQLAAMSIPGGEAKVAMDTAAKAMEELEKILGNLLEGMRYSELQAQRRDINSKLQGLQADAKTNARAIADIEKNLQALQVLPDLLEHRQCWLEDSQKLVLALEAQVGRLRGCKVNTVQDIESLAGNFEELKAYYNSLLSQLNGAF